MTNLTWPTVIIGQDPDQNLSPAWSSVKPVHGFHALPRPNLTNNKIITNTKTNNFYQILMSRAAMKRNLTNTNTLLFWPFFVASLAVCLAGPWVRCPGARVGASGLPWSPCSDRWSSRGWDGTRESLCPHQLLIALQHLSFLAQKCGHHLLWSGHILSSSLSALCGFLCSWPLTSFQVRFLELLPAASCWGNWPDLFSPFLP